VTDRPAGLPGLAIAALACLAARPALPPAPACGARSPATIAAAKEGSVIASLALPAGLAAGPTAVAIEVVDAGKGSPRIEVRFTSAAAGSAWTWLQAASAMLGPGTGPSIARLEGEDPTWLVLFSRIAPGEARPVAITIAADGESRRLDLEETVLDASDHVFGPRVLATGPGKGLLAWGESEGGSDRIRVMLHPPSGKPSAVTLAEGRLADTFAIAPSAQGYVAAWLEEDASSPAGWHLHAGSFDAGGIGLSAFEIPSRFHSQARVLFIEPGAEIGVHCIVQDPPEWRYERQAFGPSGAASSTAADLIWPAGTIPIGTPAGSGPLISWHGVRDAVEGLWAWSGGAIWQVASGAAGAPCIAPAGDGALAAWTHGQDVLVERLDLGDADADSIPGHADLCPGLPEPIDGLLDHDGCPDPVEPIASPLDASRVWFPESPPIPCVRPSRAARLLDGSLLLGSADDGGSRLVGAGGSIPLAGLPGPVTSILPLEGGGAAVAAAGGLFHVEADGSVHQRPLPPRGGTDAPGVRGLFALAQGGPAILTTDGTALVDPSTWGVTSWLGPDEEVLAGASDKKLGILLAGRGGKLWRLADAGAEPKSVPHPPGVSKDEPVDMVLAGGEVVVAWRHAGAFRRTGWKGAWSKIGGAAKEDPGLEGAERLVRSPSGEIVLVSGAGALYTLTGKGWTREDTGLEGTLVVDAAVDGASGRILVLGVGGRPAILTARSIVKRVVIPAKFFSKSGKSAKPGAGAILAPYTADLAAGRLLARIEGFSDTAGPDSANLAMSLLRAQTIAVLLAGKGVDPAGIQVIGFGEAFFAALPSAESNRRIEVVLLEP